MHCEAFIDGLAEYLDGRLRATQMARYAAHHEHCTRCARYTSRYLATIRLARESFRRTSVCSPLAIEALITRTLKRIANSQKRERRLRYFQSAMGDTAMGDSAMGDSAMGDVRSVLEPPQSFEPITGNEQPKGSFPC